MPDGSVVPVLYTFHRDVDPAQTTYWHLGDAERRMTLCGAEFVPSPFMPLGVLVCLYCLKQAIVEALDKIERQIAEERSNGSVH